MSKNIPNGSKMYANSILGLFMAKYQFAWTRIVVSRGHRSKFILVSKISTYKLPF